MPSVSGLSTPCGSSGIHDYTTKIPSNHKHWKWKWKILPPGNCRCLAKVNKPHTGNGRNPWGGKLSWGKAIVYHPWKPDLLQLHQAASDMHETAADLLLDALSHAFGCWPIVQNTRHSHCCLPIIAAIIIEVCTYLCQIQLQQNEEHLWLHQHGPQKHLILASRWKDRKCIPGEE
jgi:hypothetical protein